MLLTLCLYAALIYFTLALALALFLSRLLHLQSQALPIPVKKDERQ